MDFLLNILSHWESALAVLLVLGGLIFFHELGHFAVARLFRIGVRTFSLGFGPKLLKLRRGKTDYCLSLIPLGGYVALAGEEDEAEQPDPKGKEIDGVLFAPTAPQYTAPFTDELEKLNIPYIYIDSNIKEAPALSFF